VTKTKTMPNSTAATDHIDQIAAAYASAVESRRALQGGVRRALMALTAQYAPDLRACVAAEADARAALLAAVEQRPELFERPRSRTVSGVKFGWQSGKPSITIPDEADTIARIRRYLPQEQVDLLIRVKEQLHKPSVLDLTAGDLRRLRIQQVPAEDKPFARPVADATDKLVDLLLDEADADAAGR